MTKLKAFAAVALAATTLGAGTLAAAPSASAKPMTCASALQLAHTFIVIGNMLSNGGHNAAASYYYGRAEGMIDAAC